MQNFAELLLSPLEENFMVLFFVPSLCGNSLDLSFSTSLSTSSSLVPGPHPLNGEKGLLNLDKILELDMDLITEFAVPIILQQG